VRALIATASLLLLLGGCSGMRVVESQVSTVSTLPEGSAPLAGARYRFERLPSQINQADTASIETIADTELAKLGLVHDDAAAGYSVLLTTRMQSYYVNPWGYPSYGPGLYGPRFYGSVMVGGGKMGGIYGYGMGPGYPLGMHYYYEYNYEVSLLLRDLRTGQLVYETGATHAGPWSDRDNILRALLAAALKDFPNPPAGPRSVKVEIPN
jgi:Domain of unknown function (DUF4136)